MTTDRAPPREETLRTRVAIESLSTAGMPDLSLQPPHIIPRVQVRKYGEQKKLFISAGLLPESPSEPGLPKSEHMVTPKVDHGESGWEEWVGRGAPHIPPSFCCLSISDLACFPSRDHCCTRQGQVETHRVTRGQAGMGSQGRKEEGPAPIGGS